MGYIMAMRKESVNSVLDHDCGTSGLSVMLMLYKAEVSRRANSSEAIGAITSRLGDYSCVKPYSNHCTASGSEEQLMCDHCECPGETLPAFL